MFHRICGVEPRGELGGFVSRRPVTTSTPPGMSLSLNSAILPPFAWANHRGGEGNQKIRKNTPYTLFDQSGPVDIPQLCAYLHFIFDSPSSTLGHPRGQPPDTTTPTPLIPLSKFLPLTPRPPPEVFSYFYMPAAESLPSARHYFFRIILQE